MTQIIVDVPEDQIAFVTQLLQKLSLQVHHPSDEELTEWQRERLLASLQQVKEGKVMTTEQLREKTKKWLTV